MRDETQIQTHMCYSEFGDIMRQIQEMDADVLLIEAARSKMELLEDWKRTGYENEIGPGLYDIHSPRIPSTEEMVDLLRRAAQVLRARAAVGGPRLRPEDAPLRGGRAVAARTWSRRRSSCAKSWSQLALGRRARGACSLARSDLPVQQRWKPVGLGQRLGIRVEPEEHVVAVAEHADRQRVLLGHGTTG